MREPWGADHLHHLLDAALGIDGADQVEARAVHAWGGLARFARSSVHQHVAGDDTTVSVRVVTRGRVGVASTNEVNPAGVAATGERALASARLSPPDPTFPGLAGPAPLPPVGPRFDAATAAASPERRYRTVARLLARLGPGQEAAGALSTGATEVALATTAGARLHGLATRASVSTVVTGAGASGHAEEAAVALDALSPAEVGARAAGTAEAAVDPRAPVPGDHEVVLPPAAVATLLDHLAPAFSAKTVAEGRSPFSDRMGEAVVSPLLDLADDALSEGALGVPFDGEGTPKVRVPLLDGGVVRGLVHDRASAAAAGTHSTGHGLPAPNPFGPWPSHLALAPGATGVEELVGGIERGLLVTRFWYTREVNPKRTLLTGMTRDGTFLIEGGRRGPAVRNLRYNQSIVEALATCDGVGDRAATTSDEGGHIRAPALRLRSFRFTSASDH